MIRVKGVSKVFGDKTALKNISFEVKDREIIGLLGPNGAGKTTTMRLIVGYVRPTTGIIAVNGKIPIDDRIDVVRTTGYLPENNPLYQEMKTEEYLKFIAEMKGSTFEKNDSVCTHTGIEDVLSSRIDILSRGYKQRVGLTAALLGNPSLLILDEPTSGLDPIEQDKIRKLIKDLGKKKTIILSTHILSEVEDVATRLIIINKGSIVYDGEKPKRKGSVETLFKKLTA
ncbi:MAG TPA: ATP-binding cassette domain-containing protein [Patescibacteria group bacterium]|nr:ATP-binding cassette domain-containing protein [Patescibacteria group bacterium]